MSFVILQSADQMCGICPEPGRCCKDFSLESQSKRKRNYKSIATAQKSLDRQGLPFTPVWRKGEVRFDCPLLSVEGRCTVHGSDLQPDLCKIYEPASNSLCVFHGKAMAVKASELKRRKIVLTKRRII
jgi:hypothetical protein